MNNATPNPPPRLTNLLVLANIAALIGVAYLARRDASSESAWNTRHSRSASLASSAAILQTGRDETANTTRVHSLDNSAANDVASALPEILRRAGISAEQLTSVVPDAARPIPNTPLMRTSERITIENVSLEQLVRVAAELTNEGSGRDLESLSLRTARSQQRDTWDTEITIGWIKRVPSAMPRSD